MENKPQIGFVAPEADITLLLSELGKKSPMIFSLADILPVPFETEAYPFVLGGADGVILAARINQVEDVENIVEIVKTCKLVRQSDRFRTLIAIVLWGEAADEASLTIAHPNVLVCDSNTKNLPPTEELAKVLRTELPNIEPVDWVDRYDFIANQFALKKTNQVDSETSEKLNILQEANQNLENQLVQLKEDFACQIDEKLKSLQEENENLERELAKLKEDSAAEIDEKIKSLQKVNKNLEKEIAGKNVEIEQLIVSKDAEIEELRNNQEDKKKVKFLQKTNQSLEKNLAQLKEELEALTNEKWNALEAKQSLEQELAQLKEEFASTSQEFERLISLKNSEIEELQNNGREEKIINALQEDNQNLEIQVAQLINELAQLKEEFATESKEFKKLISLKDTVIEDLQKNQAKDNQELENQLTQLKKDHAAQTNKKIISLEKDNKILENQLTQLKKDFSTQNDEFEQLISLKNIVIEDLRNNQDEENKKLAVLVGRLNDEIEELKAKSSPDVTQLENELSAKTEEVRKLITLQSEQDKMLEESNSKIEELKAEITDISNREKLLQKDLSDLIIHLREEFLNSRHQLTGKDTEIQRLRERIERQNELTEVVLQSTSGENIASLRLEIDNGFSEDKPLYQIYSQLSLLRQECESLLKEKERIQGKLDATKKNSSSIREELETTKNNKLIAKYRLKELERKFLSQSEDKEEIKIELPKLKEESPEQPEPEEELLEIGA